MVSDGSFTYISETYGLWVVHIRSIVFAYAVYAIDNGSDKRCKKITINGRFGHY